MLKVLALMMVVSVQGLFCGERRPVEASVRRCVGSAALSAALLASGPLGATAGEAAETLQPRYSECEALRASDPVTKACFEARIGDIDEKIEHQFNQVFSILIFIDVLLFFTFLNSLKR